MKQLEPLDSSKLTYPFISGEKYSRPDIYEMVGLSREQKGGPWTTGYCTYNQVYFVFCNIGTPGRTGHDYDNLWLPSGILEWYGKTTSHTDQPQIRSMTKSGSETCIFYRTKDTDPFTFAGIGLANAVFNEIPVRVHWKILPVLAEQKQTLSTALLPEELPASSLHYEGTKTTISVNVYERNSQARQDCINRYGVRCAACKRTMKEMYGDLGGDYIHVHHLKPLADIGETYVIDPVKDLRPVCPNCHAMLHRYNPPLTIEELQTLIIR